MGGNKITTSTGVVLDPDWGMAPSLTGWARSKGFDDVTVFYAVCPDGREEYLLVRGQTPAFASQSAEAVAARIDIMAMDRDFE
jgi:hypothetical protein